MKKKWETIRIFHKITVFLQLKVFRIKKIVFLRKFCTSSFQKNSSCQNSRTDENVHCWEKFADFRWEVSRILAFQSSKIEIFAVSGIFSAVLLLESTFQLQI